MARAGGEGRDKGAKGLLSRLETPTGTKWGPFVLVGASNRDKRPMSPLARLTVGLETKITYCPGPKGCRDKWPGKKICFVVVISSSHIVKKVAVESSSTRSTEDGDHTSRTIITL